LNYRLIKLYKNLINYLLIIVTVGFIFSCKPKANKVLNKEYALENEEQNQTDEKYANGVKKFEGNLEEGKREGEWILYYETGKVWSRCNYVKNIKQGKSIVYYPNGQIAYEGMYENNKQTGNWVFYNTDGSVKANKDF
jgi:antitoxin component YwqK of YwqJK toxin-antitoxin module